MQNTKALSSASYLSIFFAPFLLPLMIYLMTKDQDVKYHSKRALISHIIPTAFSILLTVVGFIGFMSINLDHFYAFIIIFVILLIIYMILYIVLIIWNIIQVLRIVKE